MRPTKLGLKAIAFYWLVVLAYFASPYTNLLFLLFAFLSTVVVLGSIWTWQNGRGLQASLDPVDPFAAGSITETHATITNRSRRAILHAELLLQCAPLRTKHSLGTTLRIGPGETVRTKVRLPELPRGVHAIRAVEATSTYPLGVLRLVRRARSQPALVVYPQPAAELALRPVQALRSSEGAQDPSDLTDLAALDATEPELAGLRPYRDGDSNRNIDWRASARRPSDDEWIVREYEQNHQPTVEVRLDARCDEETFEQSIQLLCRLALTARDSDQSISLQTQELEGTFGQGQRPFRELLEWLATAAPLTNEAPGLSMEETRARSPAIELPSALSRLQGVATR